MDNKSKNKAAEEKPLTYWQKRDLERATEAKKRRNIFMSRRSGEESGTGYETTSSSFVGGRVESRTRVSMIGRNVEEGVGQSAVKGVRSKVGFARSSDAAKTGFAKGGSSTSKGGSAAPKMPSRPLGFH